MDNKKIKFGLSKKTILSIVILSLLICTTTCFVGYYQYKNTIEKLYNENGYVIGELILNNVDHEKVEEYTNTWTEDEYYDELKAYLDETYKASDAKYIYIVVPNADGTMRYVYDSSGANIGDTDPISKYVDEIMEIYNTGVQNRSHYFVRKSKKYGSLTSSIVPINNADGETVALLFVDVAMELIRSTLHEFIIKTILISFILMAVLCYLCYAYINSTVIIPINIIDSSLKDFYKNNKEVTNDLKEIKTNDELQVLSNSIISMEKSVINYIDEITNITAEKERIGAELNVATKIQENMLPSTFPPFPEHKEFDIFASMTPAKEVGGDFYDFFMIDDNKVGIVMADVSGKGIPAALFMAISKIIIKNRVRMGVFSPAEVLSKVNNQLCENNKVEMFVTVWLGILDINTGIITAANAGHEYPIVKHEGKYELLKDKHGFVLAGMENIKYTDYEIKLNKGDSLFVYTDGVTEATNANNELFGIDRIVDALNENIDGDCKKMVSSVHESIDEFVGATPQFDDITMLCLDYYGGTLA